MSDEDEDDVRPFSQVAKELGAEVRVGWMKADPVIEADAKALWQRMGRMDGKVDLDGRASEILGAAYIDGQLAAVSTAFIRELPFLRANFAMFRCMIAPEFRLKSLSRFMSVHGRQVLEAWALEHPEADLSGMATVHQADLRNNRKSRPVKRGSQMVLVGYTTEGEKILVAWFDHIVV
jgi:hypothetical protein